MRDAELKGQMALNMQWLKKKKKKIYIYIYIFKKHCIMLFIVFSMINKIVKIFRGNGTACLVMIIFVRFESNMQLKCSSFLEIWS